MNGNVTCGHGAFYLVARFLQKRSRLSSPPNNVVKIVESASKMSPARSPVGGIQRNRLSRLLRLALDETEPHVVTLAHELTCLEPYLELEKMRYGDRLTVKLDIEPAAREARVPGLLLQPVVENAIRHGIAPRSTPGTVTIRARLVHPNVQLEVEDDGVGMAHEVAFGVGLSNTRARLHEHYGAASALEIRSRPTGGARVRISVPQEVAA